jgi:DNA polymerase I-like protein with 3'-5' exonuclease and polymerase domains
MEIQGSAAEMTKLAMTRLWKSGALWKYDLRFYFPAHDEFVVSVVKDDAVEAIRIVHDCMVAKYSTMDVPILSSISIGPNYADQTECGDWFIQENIEAALSDIFDMRKAA